MPAPDHAHANGGGEPPNLSLPRLLLMLLTAYQPSQRFHLDDNQLRSRNKAMDVLEGDPDDGFYLLDDREVELCKLILSKVAPFVMVTHSENVPYVQDALAEAPEKKPAPAAMPVQA